MNANTTMDISSKLYLLPFDAQKEVADFIDFLLLKQGKEHINQIVMNERIDNLVKRFQNNPIPAQAPYLTRAMLHERC